MERAPRLARELMTPAPYTFRHDLPVADAAGRLIREHHSGAPVVDMNGRLLGVVSELDLIRAMASVRHGTAPCGTVGEWMSRLPLVVSPDTTIYELADLFTGVEVRRVPVVDGNELVGLISRHDVLAALTRIGLECARANRDDLAFVP